MTATPTIRAATMDDYDIVCDLLASADAHHVSICPTFFHHHDGPARPRDWFAAYVESEEADAFLARIDDEPVGFIVLNTRSLPDCPRFIPRRVAYIEEVVVAPRHRRRGVGTALMACARRWTKERDLRHIQLGVWTANTAALRLYKKEGFKTFTARMELDLE